MVRSYGSPHRHRKSSLDAISVGIDEFYFRRSALQGQERGRRTGARLRLSPSVCAPVGAWPAPGRCPGQLGAPWPSAPPFIRGGFTNRPLTFHRFRRRLERWLLASAIYDLHEGNRGSILLGG